MNKLLLSSLLLFSAFVANAADAELEALYNRSCMACHSTGAAGAPKTGDAAAWAPRLEKGMDALVASVDKGMNAMPPKGMCFDCTTEQYKALIEYMVAPK
jgi:cytochrome c5